MVTSIIAIGIFQIPTLVRLTRGSANAIWAREFVLAARASGKGGFRITIEHVLPNVLPILIVQGTIQFASRSWPKRRCPISGSAPSRRSRPGAAC
jgi:ABC-type dipeptide/oligopeptide/nickel transport systems, permease components